MKLKRTLLLLCCLTLSACGSLVGVYRYYPRIRFHLDVDGSDFAGTRHLRLGVEASNLRYHTVNSTIQPKAHYYLESSNGIAEDKAGTRIKPYIIGELRMVLPSNIVSRSGSRFELTEKDLVSISYREYMFDEKDKKYITFDGSQATNVSLSIAEFSLIGDRKGFVATPYRDGKEFDQFMGTIDGSFQEKESSRSRHLNGRFKLTWKREDRGS